MQANFEWFRTFKTIYETGTVIGAAKILHASQPGVSLHLNALEAYTGYTLFERTARKMIPTDRGNLLYQQIQGSIAVLEEIENRFGRKSGPERLTVSIGMCVETFQQALEKHIPQLDFNLIMQFGDNKKLIDSLEKGSVDLILTTTRKASNNLIFHPFTQERLILVAGKETDIKTFKQIPTQDKEQLKTWLKNQLWYNTASDLKLFNRFWEINFEEQPDFVPNYIVPNKFSIIRCLSSGKGLAVIPDFLCKEAIQKGEIHLLWEGYIAIEDTLYFCKRNHAFLNDKLDWLEKILEKEIKGQE